MKGIKSKGLDYAEHTKLGSEIQQAQVDAVNRYMLLTAKYGKSSKAAGLSRKVVKAIDSLRNELDNRACAENPRHLYPRPSATGCILRKSNRHDSPIRSFPP